MTLGGGESDEIGSLLDAGYRYALSLVHRPADAEDLLQDAWVSVLQARGPRAAGYLFRAIRSRFVDRHRRGRLVAVEPAPPEVLEALSVDAEAEARQVFAADAGEIEVALERLRFEEREALFLNVVEGYSASEIADLTETPRGTVLSLVHRAKQKLRRGLGRWEQQG